MSDEVPGSFHPAIVGREQSMEELACTVRRLIDLVVTNTADSEVLDAVVAQLRGDRRHPRPARPDRSRPTLRRPARERRYRDPGRVDGPLHALRPCHRPLQPHRAPGQDLVRTPARHRHRCLHHALRGRPRLGPRGRPCRHLRHRPHGRQPSERRGRARPCGSPFASADRRWSGSKPDSRPRSSPTTVVVSRAKGDSSKTASCAWKRRANSPSSAPRKSAR